MKMTRFLLQPFYTLNKYLAMAWLADISYDSSWISAKHWLGFSANHLNGSILRPNIKLKTSVWKKGRLLRYLLVSCFTAPAVVLMLFLGLGLLKTFPRKWRHQRRRRGRIWLLLLQRLERWRHRRWRHNLGLRKAVWASDVTTRGGWRWRKHPWKVLVGFRLTKT